MIAAGKLSERITFQQKGVTKNAIGEEVVSWSTYATVWAAAIPLRGREFHAANQTQQTVDVRFIIRSRTGITNDMRIQWDGVPYDITGIIAGTEQWAGTLEIMAVNGVRNGR